MNENNIPLDAPPIVEAVLDIDCDLPVGFELAAVEKLSRDAFASQYPTSRTQFVEEHKIEHHPDQPAKHTAKRGVQAFRFVQADEKQLVQVRAEGFSFNRLSPYTRMDDYMAEIRRTWELYQSIASPVLVRAIRLRFINRILLPLNDGNIDLDLYLKIGPKLPDENRLSFAGFLNQHMAVERETGNQVNIVLTTQTPEADKLPIIFDIGVVHSKPGEPANWEWLESQIQQLRDLKNRIFKNTLTKECLKLFQH